MPKWDYKCPHCERGYEMVFRNLAEREKWDGRVCCNDCHEVLVRQPSAPAFAVTGFNAKNGYSK